MTTREFFDKVAEMRLAQKVSEKIPNYEPATEARKRTEALVDEEITRVKELLKKSKKWK